MKFKLNKNLYELLLKVPETKDYLKNEKSQDNVIEFEIDKTDFLEVQMLINDEIVLNGMDNQDTVNDLGIKLYKLYDELLYQKKNQ